MVKSGPSRHNMPPYSVPEYIAALRLMEYRGQLSPQLLRLLRWQNTEPDGRANANDLAAVTGQDVTTVNKIYGAAGKKLGTLLLATPSESFEKGWPFLAYGEYKQGRFFWTLHEPLREALRRLELLIDDETPLYLHALETLQRRRKLSSTALKMLRFHYDAPDHDLTAGKLGTLMEWTQSGEQGAMGSANLHYGRFGAYFKEFLGPCPVTYDGSDKPMTVAYLVTFWNDGQNWHWIMRRGLRRALEELGFVTPRTPAQALALAQIASLPSTDPNSLTEMVEEAHYEGAARTVQVNIYERNEAARRKCIQHHGSTCQVCSVNLVDVYGPLAQGYIQVHHLRPISEIGATYQVDPIHDLIPVCPNCHAMLHRNRPPFTPDELRQHIELAREN